MYYIINKPSDVNEYLQSIISTIVSKMIMTKIVNLTNCLKDQYNTILNNRFNSDNTWNDIFHLKFKEIIDMNNIFNEEPNNNDMTFYKQSFERQSTRFSTNRLLPVTVYHINIE
jgi:hypothetical protein